MSTTKAASPVIEITNLHKRYHLGDEVIHALAGVDLRAARGEFVAIMGASGSGKTTLLHLIGGLDLPDEGAVRVDGRLVNEMRDHERTLFRRRRMGIVFQAFNLMPTLTALENVMLPLLVDGRPADEAQRRARVLLDQVHLGHRLKHRPALMSGGEQQRVAIARALMVEPVLILADEPTGNLDPTSAREIWTLLRTLARERGTTVLMVTHESAAAAHADVVHFIKAGRFTGVAEPKGSGDAALVAARYAQLAV
ncbi:MAG TPA: ABC transporter ATP-binding protein [Phycisphaerae bacterium]|nr:ABC transporter ATP-binding protein [Phycisphaerae bacterium]